jgi:hypothetical protein
MGPINGLSNMDTEEERSPFIIKNQYSKQAQQLFSMWNIFPWFLAFIFASLFIRERISVYQFSTPQGTFSRGFTTEFGKLINTNSTVLIIQLLIKIISFIESSFASIAVQKVRFKSGLSVNENNTLYRTFDPNGPQYVGNPSPTIDNAWKVLIGGMCVKRTWKKTELY